MNSAPIPVDSHTASAIAGHETDTGTFRTANRSASVTNTPAPKHLG